MIVVKTLGPVDYESTVEAMRAFTETRGPETADELWLCEHPPTYTQGLAGRADHVLAAGGIPVVQTNRGGQVTYHGPGQVVAYPLINLRRRGLNVRTLVDRLEQATLQMLREYSVVGERHEGAPGVYVGAEKIMAMGLRIRRGASFHGMALNVCMDLEPFSRINPCGYQGLRHTSVYEQGGPADLQVIAQAWSHQLAQVLGYQGVQIAAANLDFLND